MKRIILLLAVFFGVTARASSFHTDIGASTSNPFFSSANPTPAWAMIEAGLDWDDTWQLDLGARAAPPLKSVESGPQLYQYEISILAGRQWQLSGVGDLRLIVNGGVARQSIAYSDNSYSEYHPAGGIGVSLPPFSLRWDVRLSNALFQQFASITFRLF